MENQTQMQKKQTKGYLAIFTSQSLSIMGSSIVSFALIWYLTIETGSAMILSLAMFVQMVPMLLLSPVTGVLSDRINKKVLLMLPDFSQAVVDVLLIYLFVTGAIQIWHILFLLAIRGVAQAFQMPVNMTLPALMVDKETIPRVNALNSILNSVIFIVSPAIGAMLLGLMPIGPILWIDVITYLPAQFVLFFVSIPKVRQVTNKIQESFLNDFKEGLAYIKTSGLMPLIITVAILSIFINPLFNLVPLFITNVFQGGAYELALVEVAFQSGVFICSTLLLILKIKPTFGRMNIGILFLFISSLMMALIPSGHTALLVITIFIIGLSVSYVDVQFLSLFQLIIPPEIQGRVFSSVFTIMKSFVPIGVIALGILADTTSILFVFIFTPLIALIVTIILLLVTGIRKMDEKFSIGKYEINKVQDNLEPLIA